MYSAPKAKLCRQLASIVQVIAERSRKTGRLVLDDGIGPLARQNAPEAARLIQRLFLLLRGFFYRVYFLSLRELWFFNYLFFFCLD